MSKGDLGIVEKVKPLFPTLVSVCLFNECHLVQGVDDPQTEADRRAQLCIIGNLNKKFPLMSIIGEEDLAQESNVELVNDIDKEVLNLRCPEELVNVTEEDVSIEFTESFQCCCYISSIFLSVCCVGGSP